MPAAVEEHVDLAVQIARHHHRLARDPRAVEIRGCGYLAFVSDIDPDPAEDLLHLQLEDLRVCIDAAMNAIVPHQAPEELIRIRCHEYRSFECHFAH